MAGGAPQAPYLQRPVIWQTVGSGIEHQGQGKSPFKWKTPNCPAIMLDMGLERTVRYKMF